jgi:hypothetical protein
MYKGVTMVFFPVSNAVAKLAELLCAQKDRNYTLSFFSMDSLLSL